jgi:hypothetical protein
VTALLSVSDTMWACFLMQYLTPQLVVLLGTFSDCIAFVSDTMWACFLMQFLTPQLVVLSGIFSDCIAFCVQYHVTIIEGRYLTIYHTFIVEYYVYN